jgi:hypothetical protein
MGFIASFHDEWEEHEEPPRMCRKTNDEALLFGNPLILKSIVILSEV